MVRAVLYNLANAEAQRPSTPTMMTFQPSPKTVPKTLFLALALAIFGLSAATVFYQLGQPNLWVDEAYTWFFVAMPWAKMIQAVRIDAVNPPFFYAYTKVFTDFLGTGEAALRLPSVMAFLAGVAASLWVGYQLEGRLGAIACAWFWGFHPMLIWFARDARPYGLAAGLSVIGLGLFLHIKRTGRASPWALALALIVVSLGLISHYFFILFAILTGVLATVEMKGDRFFFRAWAGTLLAAVIPLLVWLWWFLQLPSPSFGIGWISKPPLTAMGGTLWNLISGYGAAFDWGSLAFGLVSAALIAAGLRHQWRWAALTILAPILGVWAISQFRPVYVDRYFIVLIPFFLPLVARGTRQIFQRRLTKGSAARWGAGLPAALILFLATLGAVRAVHTQPAYRKEDWRQVAEWLQRAPPGTQVLLSEPELTLPLAYYAPDISSSGVIGTTPCRSTCLWVLRQPYTITHAFSQSVSDPDRSGWQPPIPANCRATEQRRWDSGLEARLLTCSPDG